MAKIPFGEKLKRTRKHKRLSQAELGKKMGVSSACVSHWETERTEPDYSQKKKLKKILGGWTLKKSASKRIRRSGSFAARIRSARRDRGLSVKQLSEESGLSVPTIYGIERGRSANPHEDTVRKLEKALESLKAEATTDSSADSSNQLSDWLSRARNAKGLSVARLSDKSGLSAPAIYSIESGRIVNPRQSTIKKLERVLESPLSNEIKREIRAEATIAGLGEFIEFDPHIADDIPAEPGIYMLYDISERPIYVGQGGNIRARIASHIDKFWFKRPIVEAAAYVKIDEKSLREKVEKLLIRFLKSNAVINKQNVDR